MIYKRLYMPGVSLRSDRLSYHILSLQSWFPLSLTPSIFPSRSLGVCCFSASGAAFILIYEWGEHASLPSRVSCHIRATLRHHSHVCPVIFSSTSFFTVLYMTYCPQQLESPWLCFVDSYRSTIRTVLLFRKNLLITVIHIHLISVWNQLD